MSVSNISASSGFIFSAPGMTSDERVAAMRHNMALADAVSAQVQKERDYDDPLAKYQEVKASRPKMPTMEEFDAKEAELHEYMKTVKVVYEMHASQGTIRVRTREILRQIPLRSLDKCNQRCRQSEITANSRCLRMPPTQYPNSST